MQRKDKRDYYLDIAADVAMRGTCLRRNYGAVIVNHDEIVATGYTGAPRGEVNCCDRKVCKREQLGIPSGERYELCRSVHAEMNAIISASRQEMLGATLYLAGLDAKTGQLINAAPCKMCSKLIRNAGIETIIERQADGEIKEVDVRCEALLEALDIEGDEEKDV